MSTIEVLKPVPLTREITGIDDIITTGFTLTQAIQTMHKANKEVLFCITLADAGLK